MWFLLACAGDPWVTEAVTDGGTWTVSTPAAFVDVAVVDLPLAARAGESPATGLEIYVEPFMPDMGHGSRPGDAAEVGDGEYTVPLDFMMAGLWVLEGEVTGAEGTETFELVVEAR